MLELLSGEEAKLILSQPATLKREDILAVYEAGPEAVIELINSLIDVITELQERVKALADQLNQNSRNSNKPLQLTDLQNPKANARKAISRWVGKRGILDIL